MAGVRLVAGPPGVLCRRPGPGGNGRPRVCCATSGGAQTAVFRGAVSGLRISGVTARTLRLPWQHGVMIGL